MEDPPESGGEATLASALRYLQDLGWDAVYRRPPGAAPGALAQPVAGPPAARGAGAPASAPADAAPAPAPLLPGLAAGDPQSGSSDAEERARSLAELALRARACERCELAGGRTQVVFGSGDPDADLMMIGEGPGYQEDRQGLPFVGPAGELLTRILLAIDRRRDQVYIANVVKCRPPHNRDPRPEEVAACRSYLDRQIALVRPRVIVALGRVAAQTLLGNDLPVGRLRGEWWQIAGIPLRVTYHPAALLRDAGLKRPTWEDMKVVRDRLRESSPA